MSTFDKEWQDGDDAELENAALSEGFTEGKESLRNDMRSMFFALAEALYDEMEVHHEPSVQLIESVHDWSLTMLGHGFLSDDEFDGYHEMVNEAGLRTEME
tara:strand:- start:131 stop:433 length:303 start_codon:yes stop_codon:yes gene_type:complete